MSLAFQGAGNAFQFTGFAFQQEVGGTTPPVTGGGFFFDYEHAVMLRRKRKREREKRLEEAEQIQKKIDREIAQLLYEQEAKDAERRDFERIQALADKYAGTMKGTVPKRVSIAIMNAQEARTMAALEQMQREIERMLEEDEVALILILNQSD